MEKLVSIVIPAYNAGAFISKTLDSVLSQTYKCFEVVIINDGSTDNTLNIIERYAQKDNRIRVFSQENGGVSAARNTALTKVKGDYIVYVDADDALLPNALEDMVSLADDDVDFVVASHNDVRFIKVPYVETPRIFTPEDIENEFIEFDAISWWPWAKLFKTSIILDNNLKYDETAVFGEDHIFNLIYGKHIKNKVVVTDKIVYDYHYVRGGICSRYYSDMNLKQKKILQTVTDFFGGMETLPYKYKSFFTAEYIRYCVDYYCIWLTPGNAAPRIRETFEVYSDYLDDEIIKSLYSQEQFEMIKRGDFSGFTKNFIITNPKRTLWKKVRRTVRRSLELGQKIFLQRK